MLAPSSSFSPVFCRFGNNLDRCLHPGGRLAFPKGQYKGEAMLHILFVALMQAASGAPADPPSTTTPPAVQPAKDAEPQMICHWEHVTGSNLKQVKVCKPKNAKEEPQDSALQRALERARDVSPKPSTFGN